jgi:hypothetical protein
MIKAFTIAIPILILAFVMNIVANWLGMQPTPPEERFLVVDNYKGCDVVRYSDQQMATYKYFLHCNK